MDNFTLWHSTQRPCIALRQVLSLVLIVAIGVIIASVVLTNIYNLNPCPLCIFQRLLYLLIATLALLGVLLNLPSQWGRIVFVVPTLLLSWSGVATAAYQSWLQLTSTGEESCLGSDPNLIERLVDWLGAQYPPFFLATGFCDSTEWVFLGLSIANWSLLTFLFLSLVLLLGLRSGGRVTS